MRTLDNYPNYNNCDLSLTSRDVNLIAQSGRNDDAVAFVKSKRYVKRQLKQIDPVSLSKELREHGAWDDEQLQDHEENLTRWIWMSAWDISERNSR